MTGVAPQPPVVPVAPDGTLRGARMGCSCMWCRSAEYAATVPVPAGDTAHDRDTR
ncbi:MAG: hypothetical protein ACRDS0_00480 [Pseudonocardiaceae bacterium]